MSEKDVSLLLQDIKISVSKILDYTNNVTFDDYEADAKTRDAVEHNFQIIGEAANRVPAYLKEQHPQIEWRIIKDFRNFIIHEYFGINNRIVWDIIQNRLPDLLSAITALIDDSGGSTS